MQESDASCAEMRVVRVMSKSSARTCPFCSPQQAMTHARESAQSEQSPRGFEMVSIVCSRFRSAKMCTEI